jgi:hypothetical protein
MNHRRQVYARRYDGGMPLDSVWVKFIWANEHFKALNAHIHTYINAHPSDIVPKPNSTFERDGIQYVMAIVEITAQIPNEIPLLLGDVFSNLRSCLDYLVWELVRANGNQPIDRNSFPICKSEKAFRDARKRGDLDGLAPTADAFIESLQPYILGPDMHRSNLVALHDFTNINKHRRLLVAQLSTSLVPPDPNFIRMVNGQAQAPLNPPRERQAEFGPFEVIDGKVKVNSQFMAYVTFDEAPAKDFEILSFMAQLIDSVAGIIRHCERFA